MKKFMVIMVVVLAIIMTVTAAYAAGNKTTTYEKAKETIEKWIKENNLDKWHNFDAVDGVMYGYGAVYEKDIINDGAEWSTKEFDIWSIEKFDICEINTEVVDIVDGVEIYRSQAQSETTALGHIDDNEYYCADVYFVVYNMD